MTKKNIKIIVATHKKYQMPEDPMYLPVRVGAALGSDNFGYQGDDEGENISSLNKSFCELTGLFWAWKNLDADYIGLVHYRRYFCEGKRCTDPFSNILTSAEISRLLDHFLIIVPKKRRYYIETLYSHYSHTHYAQQLDQTRVIIQNKYPEYLTSFDKVMKRTYGYMFNMMVMRRDFINQYCTWLFDILFILKDTMVMPELDDFQARFYGRISELLFNVWLDYQIETGVIAKNNVKEISCINMERVNWLVKGSSFLMAKFFHQRYKKSF